LSKKDSVIETCGESLSVSRIDAWFSKCHLPDISKFTMEDTKKALEELEQLVEEFCQK
jgi:hypothetical protein